MRDRGKSQIAVAATRTEKPKCWLAAAAVVLWNRAPVVFVSSASVGGAPNPNAGSQCGGASG